MNAAKARKREIRRLSQQPAGPWERVDDYHRRIYSIGAKPLKGMRDYAYKNLHISVQITDEQTSWGEVVHLWIRRHDMQPIRSWATLQRVKNDLVGPERTAIEVYPAESALVDSANMYHLWVLPEGFALPFRLTKGAEP